MKTDPRPVPHSITGATILEVGMMTRTNTGIIECR